MIYYCTGIIAETNKDKGSLNQNLWAPTLLKSDPCGIKLFKKSFCLHHKLLFFRGEGGQTSYNTAYQIGNGLAPIFSNKPGFVLLHIKWAIAVIESLKMEWPDDWISLVFFLCQLLYSASHHFSPQPLVFLHHIHSRFHVCLSPTTTTFPPTIILIVSLKANVLHDTCALRILTTLKLKCYISPHLSPCCQCPDGVFNPKAALKLEWWVSREVVGGCREDGKGLGGP